MTARALDSPACSQLLYRTLTPAAAQPRRLVIALHGAGADATQLDGIAAAGGGDAAWIAPQAARSCNPVLGGGNRWGAYGGYRWYLDVDAGVAEPASFGDSLAQLELFVREACANYAIAAADLVGIDQGASLALALLLVAPERVASVVAVDGWLPLVPGWAPPGVELDRRAVLLVTTRTGENERTERANTCADALTRCGAHVTLQWLPSAAARTDFIAGRVAAHLQHAPRAARSA